MTTMNEMIWKNEDSSPEALRLLEKGDPVAIKVTDRKLVGLLNELAGADADADVFPSLKDMIRKCLSFVKNRLSVPTLFLTAEFAKRDVMIHYDSKKKEWTLRFQRKGL